MLYKRRMGIIEFWQQPEVQYSSIAKGVQTAHVVLDEKEAYQFFTNLDKNGSFIFCIVGNGLNLPNEVVTCNRNLSFAELSNLPKVKAFVCNETEFGPVMLEKGTNKLYSLSFRPKVLPNDHAVKELLRAEDGSRELKMVANKNGDSMTIRPSKITKFVRVNNQYVRDVENNLNKLGKETRVTQIDIRETVNNHEVDKVEVLLLKVADCFLLITEHQMSLAVGQHVFRLHDTDLDADYNELLQLLSSLTGISVQGLSQAI